MYKRGFGMDINSLIAPLFSIVAGIGGAWLTFAQLKKHYTDEFNAKIAEMGDDCQKAMDAEVKVLNSKLELINKDAYKGEIKNLGEKIESLRSQVQEQHNQLIGLLTKLVQDK
jgi:uncharacterized coiled-coil DUF342 family protein